MSSHPRGSFLIAVLVGVSAAGSTAAGWPTAGLPSPTLIQYGGARVGDWATYRSRAAAGETMRRTVSGRTADAVTVRTERSTGPAVEATVGLTGPPARVSKLLKEEVLGSGRETLTVGGVKYACAWQKTRISAADGGTEPPTPIVVTIWTCKDVPVGGSVKWEVEQAGRTETWELTGCGRGK
jgi:hypothetical protein